MASYFGPGFLGLCHLTEGLLMCLKWHIAILSSICSPDPHQSPSHTQAFSSYHWPLRFWRPQWGCTFIWSRAILLFLKQNTVEQRRRRDLCSPATAVSLWLPLSLNESERRVRKSINHELQSGQLFSQSVRSKASLWSEVRWKETLSKWIRQGPGFFLLIITTWQHPAARWDPNGLPELPDGAFAQYAAECPGPAGRPVAGRQAHEPGSGLFAWRGPCEETWVRDGGGVQGALWGSGEGQRPGGESGTQAGRGGEAGGGHPAGDQLHWGGGEELQAGGAAVQAAWKQEGEK